MRRAGPPMRCRVAATALSLALFGAGGVAPAAEAATPGPSSAPEYWFDDWHIHELWRAGVRGQGVTIAEIDTGVNAALPQLAGRILPGRDFGNGGNGQVDRDVNAFGHGTAMASIMVARPGVLGIEGMAPAAKVLPVAVPLRGTTDQSAPGRLPEAIRWAADHGARVISMSIGGTRTPDSPGGPCPADEQRAVFHALRVGAIVIAAVGNTGPTRNTVEEPGACLGVVSVGAVDETGSVARFSAREPYLTLVAPGVNIPSLGRVAGAAYAGDGTSQAAAIVSAAAALVWSRYPRLSGQQVVTRLLATVDDPHPRHSPAYGYGLLDAYRAVTAQAPASVGNPVYATAAPFLSQYARPSTGLGKRPAPAATRRSLPRPSRLPVASPASSSPEVPVGIGLAVLGLLALVAVVVLRGVSRRRLRSGVPRG
ncbi:MAG TPA: S8 family serine peptidase [Jatrophihabitans sp.]|nr:S8 family serine peptidase [Jatrophihabitans sp.]